MRIPILQILSLFLLCSPCYCFWGYISSPLEYVKGYFGWLPTPKAWSPTPKKQCHILPNYKSTLEFSLEKRVFGQHIALYFTKIAVIEHIEESEPDRALTMIFAGTTGTGKNYISSLVGSAMFGPDFKHFVHIFSGRNAFPNPQKVMQYREELNEQIKAAIRDCERAVFIFDEIDKMPPGIIDIIKPYIDFHHSLKGVVYRKATFFFLTNLGGKEINRIYFNKKSEGALRKDIEYKAFERQLRTVLFESNNSMFEGADVISSQLISYYVPFLPLEKEHVEQCIWEGMKRFGMPDSDFKRVSASILEQMDFVLGEYSIVGCKKISDLVRIENRINNKNKNEL